MATRQLLQSFNGGEVTPEFYGHVGDTKYQTGLALCRNFIVLPHGPVANRPGTQYVRKTKDSTKRSRLIRFSYGVVGGVPQSFAVETGEKYFRFHTGGATLLPSGAVAYNGATAYNIGDLVTSSGVTYYSLTAANTGHTPVSSPTFWYPLPATGEYEIPTPYLEADLFSIHYVQSADVVTLVHPNYAPMELRRGGASLWTLTAISFVSTLTAPGSPVATATVATGAGLVAMNYKISAVGSTGIEESLPSASATCNNNLLTTGNYNTITFATVTGAARYNIYKQSNGLYGFIGQTDALTFKDDNITADISKTPPIQNNPFNSTGNYPGAVSYFDQRRCFAGTINQPQNFWFTRQGTESNLAYSIPTRDEDSIQYRVAAREASRILHMVPLTSLVMLTSSAEFGVISINSDALTPQSTSVKPQSYIGTSDVQPVIVNNNVIFAAGRGGHLRELAYNFQANGYITGDLSLRAPHLFDNKTVVDMAYAKSPQPVIWTPSSDGTVVGLTYVPEQQVGGFHHHDTYTKAGQSLFEANVVVEEGDEDAQYFIVNRVINGASVRLVERLASRLFVDPADAFFIDCGLTYAGAPATTISGLNHIEGETVNILLDGAVHPQRTVTGGSITLQYAGSKVQIGLPIQADMQTLPLMFQVEALGQGRSKNVNNVWLRVSQSGGIKVGPSFSDLTDAQTRTDEAYGDAPALVDGEEEIMIQPDWGSGGQVCIRQDDPLPLTICSITMEVAIGG